MLRKTAFLFAIVIISTLCVLFKPEPKDQVLDVYADMQTELLLSQRNAVIVSVTLPEGSELNKAMLQKMSGLSEKLKQLDGVSAVDSLINARVIKSQTVLIEEFGESYESDEIVVERVIPDNIATLDDAFFAALPSTIEQFPELQSYISSNQDAFLFFTYFGNSILPLQIEQQMSELQASYQTILPFEYTGRSPILAKTEHLLTKDIKVFLPLLLILVTAIFIIFRNLRAMASAWVLIAASLISAYLFIQFLGVNNSPLVLLVPVFGLGLLSDYIIHYFYHQFYELEAEKRSIQQRLLFPLSLTAISTLTGFISLLFIDGSGHRQLGLLISAAVVITFAGVFLWLPYLGFKASTKKILPRFQLVQIRIFNVIHNYRRTLFITVAACCVLGLLQLPKLQIEPYPIGQLPASNTIKKSDELINQHFFGTVPYFLEIDTGEASGLLSQEALLKIEQMNQILQENESVGYNYSILSVLKRINYYFYGDEESLFEQEAWIYPSLIEQFLIVYSSSTDDPLEFGSLVNSSYRYFSIRGMVHYQDVNDLNNFYQATEDLRQALPDGWSLSVHGMINDLADERSRLRNNWVISFLIGSVLIFITVLAFYRKLRLALLSLVPGFCSMLFSLGIIATAGLSIDAFSIIFVAIITGLVIDYSIHTLAALESLPEKFAQSTSKAFGYVMGYSGVPIFLSFLTSLVSFSVLFLSSFSGARNLGLLLVTSLVVSFFFSIYLLPLLALSKKSSSNKANQ
ncbi:efflux RND transporter permease subunit [Reinekea thalattae]|uniref:MMPL family transporter n=1 Tax=Reinekea thalattae TaxID=2593301 RepID=A0A5C8ZCJ4_9GAMM|nr:efflux RND transporter permease subunit [Reinekea thalattae]TXR54883.1 MMPL family transporter [Reinekea thalattae]